MTGYLSEAQAEAKLRRLAGLRAAEPNEPQRTSFEEFALGEWDGMPEWTPVLEPIVHELIPLTGAALLPLTSQAEQDWVADSTGLERDRRLMLVICRVRLRSLLPRLAALVAIVAELIQLTYRNGVREISLAPARSEWRDKRSPPRFTQLPQLRSNLDQLDEYELTHALNTGGLPPLQRDLSRRRR